MIWLDGYKEIISLQLDNVLVWCNSTLQSLLLNQQSKYFFCGFLSLVLEICFCFLKRWSEIGDQILPQSPSSTVWMSRIWVLCNLQEFWPYLPQNIWIPIEIRIWHITYGWYNKMNSLSFLWANNTLSQSQSKSTAESLIKVSHDSQS